MNRPVCRRCLFSETDPEAYRKTIREYVNSLPASLRTDPETYALRISACKNCDQLMDGMCRKCGCFVEVRAAKKALDCPHEEPRWNSIL